jgi:hypothetical protein
VTGQTPVDRLEDLASAIHKLATAGVRTLPMFTVNMLTRGPGSAGSDSLCLGDPSQPTSLAGHCLADGLAMLAHAESLGLPIDYVELGNELYLPSDLSTPDNNVVFPTGSDYARAALAWIRALKTKFPGVLVAVEGASPDLAAGSSSARTRAWNFQLAAQLAPTQTATYSSQSADGEAWHLYSSAALSRVPGSQCNDGSPPAGSACQEAFNGPEGPDEVISTAKTTNAAFNTSVLAQRVAHTRAWVTEYQLYDPTDVARGTWAAGLFDAAGTLLFADDCLSQSAPNATACDLQTVDVHNLVNDPRTSDAQRVGYTFGAIFTMPAGTSPFVGYPTAQYDGSSGSNPTPVPSPFALSAIGFAMRVVNAGISGASSAQRLMFNANRAVGEPRWGLMALLGDAFTSSGRTRVVVVNSDPLITYDVDLSRVLTATGPTVYQIVSGDPRRRIANSSDLQQFAGTLSGTTVTLPPYSVMTARQ